MHLLYILLVLLLTTRICAEIAVRLKQPALVGELAGGILLGLLAAAFPGSDAIVGSLSESETFQSILDLAIFFLMLLAGIHLRPKDLTDASSAAIPIAIAGMVVPLIAGFGLGWFWLPDSDFKLAQSVFLGVALAVTAVPVAVKVLMDLDQLESPVGRVVIAAAVIDDVLSLVLLAVLTSLISADQELTLASILQLGGSVVAFFAIAWLAGRFVLPWVGRIVGNTRLDHAEFSVLIVFGLALSVLAELMGMHFLIGAFAAGVFFTRSIVGTESHKRLTSQVEALTMGFLAPVFFASIGMHLDLSVVAAIPGFLIVLLLVATVGKLAGAGIVARMRGFDRSQSVAVGAAMNARGAVEIIIADIALRAGLFSQPTPIPPVIEYMFSAIVLMAIVTTIGSPMLLKRSLDRAGSGTQGKP